MIIVVDKRQQLPLKQSCGTGVDLIVNEYLSILDSIPKRLTFVGSTKGEVKSGQGERNVLGGSRK
jgi:hypothetical protein